MPDLIVRRAALAQELAETIRAHAETSASRRERWGQTFEAQRFNGENITTIRSNCDHACVHLDAEADRLHGDMDALRVEIAQVDAEIGVSRV